MQWTEHLRSVRSPRRNGASPAWRGSGTGPALGLAVALLASCTEQGPSPLVWIGKSSESAPASTAASIFWIDATVNANPKAHASVIVDTGAPVSIFNPNAFGSDVADGDGRVATLSFGGVTLWKVPIIGMREPKSTAPTGNSFGGILGYTAYGQFVTSFNYRDRTVSFGGAPLPNGIETAHEASFALEGGGLARASDEEIVRFPASRVLVTATIEGRPHTLLVDTGASWIGLDSGVFATLTSDGRATLQDDARLESGATTASVTRLRTVSAFGFEVDRPVAASGSGIDELLTSISAEVGHSVDGMLGAPFLRQFLVTIDYPNGKISLGPYSTHDHIRDEYERVGIELRAALGATGYTYTVSKVFERSDAAAQQVEVDERLLSIGGQRLDNIAPADADRLLLGTPKTTIMLEFADRTLGVRVDDLLPLP